MPSYTFDDDVRLTRAEAVEFLRKKGFHTTKAGLETAVTRGNGPLYQKWGKRCVYRVADLLEWAESRLTPPARTAMKHRIARTAPRVSQPPKPEPAPCRVMRVRTRIIRA